MAGSTMRAMAVKAAGAMVLYAGIHSLLASRKAKQLAARVFGERQRNGLYRTFYLAQSAAGLAVLWSYLRRLPDRDVYRVRGPWVMVMHGGQAAALLYAVQAARAVGVYDILGVSSLKAWLHQGDEVPPEPEAQGPSVDSCGQIRAVGPFRSTRHPLNLAPLPILWLSPRMTVKLAIVAGVSTLYLFLGAFHEEARLSAAYGESYLRYRDSGCPFYLPIAIQISPG